MTRSFHQAAACLACHRAMLSLVVMDISTSLKCSLHCQHANDTELYSIHSHFSVVDDMACWFLENRLLLNSAKLEAVLVCARVQCQKIQWQAASMIETLSQDSSLKTFIDIMHIYLYIYIYLSCVLSTVFTVLMNE